MTVTVKQIIFHNNVNYIERMAGFKLTMELETYETVGGVRRVKTSK